MSQKKFDSDGFQIVNTKRSSKNKSTKVPRKDISFIKQDIVIDIEKSHRRILSAVDELRNSKYFEDVSKALRDISKDEKVTEIICFGLGHIGECNISRYQLALLLTIKNIFHPAKVLVHDPIFYCTECELLKRLNIEVIEQNNEGIYELSENEFTIVYLPHCPKQLTNNFLWSNWNLKLQHCILISNSFTSLIDNQPSRTLKETVPYIYKISPYTKETVFENSFIYKDIFNDTSIHWFPKENIQSLSLDFWSKQDKPTYENTEEFITSLMVEKLIV